jgi:glutathione S-transferase
MDSKTLSFHTLYGTPLSLYTGKARSYLIKNRIAYREVTPTTAHFASHVLPLAHRLSMPTLETSDGDVIRDGAAILDHFESRAGYPNSPKTPCQRILSDLLDVIGMEGLLRPAMHYRWNFPEENEAFLKHHFQALAPPGADAGEIAQRGMGRMRQAAVSFGVVQEAFQSIESRYLSLLAVLDQHFAAQPYLLGGRPCMGDFSLIAPFYGHLGRDPKPISLMQAKAVNLFRWVERMNRPEPDSGEFRQGDPFTAPDTFPGNDEIPETLGPVLRQLAVDFVPETLAAAEKINDWLLGQDDLPSGTPLERGVGMASFEVEGSKVTALAQPYRFYLLSRVHAHFDALSPAEQKRVESMLEQFDLLPILSTRLNRSIGRQDNHEVWL